MIKVGEIYGGTGWSRLLSVSLCAILAAVVLLCATYVGMLKTTVEGETDRYLGEVSRHVAALVNYKVEANFQALRVAAENWNRRESENVEFQRLEALAQKYGFDRIGVIGQDGWARTTDGLSGAVPNHVAEVADVLKTGSSRLMPPGYSMVDGDLITVYLVPILKDGRVDGALFASVGAADMQTLLSVESFDGEGYSRIINSQGDFLLGAHKGASPDYQNLFELLEETGKLDKGSSIGKMREDLAAGRSGRLYYSQEGAGRHSMSYDNLKVEEDWYLISVVPESVAGAKCRTLIHWAVGMNATIVVLFLALILTMLWQYRKHRRTLERVALVDNVTKGMNRPCFELRAGQAVRESPLGTYVLMALDIQGFKLINDSSGSAEGDRTLRYVYTVLLRHLGEGELAARISADNFSILIKQRTRAELCLWLERVVEAINSFNEGRERKYYLPVTAGIYAIDEAGLDMVAIQDRANVARKHSRMERTGGRLYACAFYSDVERIQMLRDKEMEDRKEQAISQREFIVYLQPKIALDTGRVAGAEALVRWQDPERGLIPPDEFIPTFERNGFITKVDLYVFEEVCRLLRDWIDRGLEPVPISVNLSRVHLGNPNFLDDFQVVRNRYDVPAGLLEFEFTETVAAEHLEVLIQVTQRLHALGYRCALDDFGSGSSSLNTLKDVPVDVLKLDRAFFSGLGVGEERGRAVVESAVALARRLHMQTVSEGVETMEQVEMLRRAKCDMVQGFVFSKPIPIEAFETLAFCGEKAAAANGERRS